jgi:hypothetical protein
LFCAIPAPLSPAFAANRSWGVSNGAPGSAAAPTVETAEPMIKPPSLAIDASRCAPKPARPDVLPAMMPLDSVAAMFVPTESPPPSPARASLSVRVEDRMVSAPA